MPVSINGNGTMTGVNNSLSGIGKILQVQSTTKTDTFTATAVNLVWQDVTGLSVTITPKYATSKILLSATTTWWPSGSNVGAAYLRFVRNSTPIGIGDAAGSRQRIGFGGVLINTGYAGSTFSSQFLDSPTTTNTITYKIQVETNTQAVRLNYRGDDADTADYLRTTSSISAMEVME
jgi:hypothetical protein